VINLYGNGDALTRTVREMNLLNRLGLTRGNRKMIGKLHCKHRSPFDIDEDLIKKIHEIEDIIDTDIIINSGCRCPDCNKAVGGKNHSAHLKESHSNNKCKALDIHAPTSRMKWNILEAAVKSNITRIGIGSTFIHVDTGTADDGYPPFVVWTY